MHMLLPAILYAVAFAEKGETGAGTVFTPVSPVAVVIAVWNGIPVKLSAMTSLFYFPNSPFTQSMKLFHQPAMLLKALREDGLRINGGAGWVPVYPADLGQ